MRNVIETTCAIFLVVLFIALCFSPCETPYDLKEQTYILDSLKAIKAFEEALGCDLKRPE